MESKDISNQLINKDKRNDENEIKEIISPDSTCEEVSKFLESYLNFKGSEINISGKMLFELSEDDMKKLGMNEIQRKTLIHYINKIK